MVKKNETKLSLALLKRSFQPTVLRFTKGPIPIVIFSTGHGMTKWIKDDKLSVCPFEFIIILRESNTGFFKGISRIETIRRGVRDIPLSRGRRPNIGPSTPRRDYLKQNKGLPNDKDGPDSIAGLGTGDETVPALNTYQS